MILGDDGQPCATTKQRFCAFWRWWTRRTATTTDGRGDERTTSRLAPRAHDHRHIGCFRPISSVFSPSWATARITLDAVPEHPGPRQRLKVGFVRFDHAARRPRLRVIAKCGTSGNLYAVT